MGGGGAMRAAAKAAGLGIANGSLRGLPPVSTAERPIAAAARKAAHPVSAVVSSSSEDVKSPVLIASQNEKIGASVQRPSWDMDDWEFAGAEDELVMESGEPMPRLVFGGAPTPQEAKEATSELKEVIEKVYLSSPNSAEAVDSSIATKESSSPLLSNPEYSETKACVTNNAAPTPSVPKNALQAFKFLHESPVAQGVVASIACDPNVWHAVLQNESLAEFLQSHKTDSSLSGTDLIISKSVANAVREHSAKAFDGSSISDQFGEFGEVVMGLVQNIKVTVVEMVSNVTDFFQNLFGGLAADKASGDGSSRPTFMDKALGASSIMGLVIMVIMVVVLRRG